MPGWWHTGKVRLPPTLKPLSRPPPRPGRLHTGKVRLPPTLKRHSVGAVVTVIGYGEGSPSPYIEARRRRSGRRCGPAYGEGSPSPYIEAPQGPTGAGQGPPIRGRFAFPLH